MLSLVPKSGFPAPDICEPCIPDPSSDTEMTLIEPSFNPGKVEDCDISISQVVGRGNLPSKKKNDTVQITLVHGDTLVLVGDNFQVICVVRSFSWWLSPCVSGSHQADWHNNSYVPVAPTDDVPTKPRWAQFSLVPLSQTVFECLDGQDFIALTRNRVVASRLADQCL